MHSVREKWTDERLDDLKKTVDDGFGRVDTQFARVDARFDAMNSRFDAMHRTMIHGFVGMAGVMVTGFVALVLAQL